MEHFRPQLNKIEYELNDDLTDEAEVVADFLGKHPELPIPNFEVLYNKPLKSLTKIKLARSFIIRNYIVGAPVRIRQTDGQQNPLSQQEIVDDFRANFRNLKLPEDLPTEAALKYINKHYKLDYAFSLLQEEEGMSYEEVSELFDEMQAEEKIVTKVIAPSQLVNEELSREVEGFYQTAKHEQKKVEEVERPKKPWELACIGIANDAVAQIMGRFGMAFQAINPEQVHIAIKPLAKNKDFRGHTGAYFSWTSQEIYIQETQSPTTFIDLLIHEMIHANSYFSVRLNGQTKDWDTERAGLSMKTRSSTALDEAVISSLEIEAFNSDTVRSNPLLAKHFQVLERYKQFTPVRFMPFREDMIGIKRVLYLLTSETTRGYESSRKSLNKLTNGLAEKNDISQDGILAQFAQATLGKSLLPIGRLVDRTYGKGVFRQLISAVSEQDLAKIVNSLN